MRPGLISPRVAKRMRARRKSRRDEGELGNGPGMPIDHINRKDYQSGGLPSASGGAGPQRQIHVDHIDSQNKRVWPSGTDVKRRSMSQGVKGGLAGSTGNPGNWYSGGKGR